MPLDAEILFDGGESFIGRAWLDSESAKCTFWPDPVRVLKDQITGGTLSVGQPMRRYVLRGIRQCSVSPIHWEVDLVMPTT